MIDIIKIIIWPVVLFFLQELVSYILNIFFSNAGKKFPSILNFIYEKKKQRFYSIMNSEEYKEFEYEYLKEYYGEDFFTKVLDEKSVPVYTIKYDMEQDEKRVDSIRFYDKLGNKENVDFSFDSNMHQKYKKNKYYKQYNRIVGRNINAPDRPGFMLDKIICNQNGMIQFKGYVGTYAENVYSNHVLEYELYKLFLKRKRKNIKELCKCSSVRNVMHASVGVERTNKDYIEKMKQSLISGEGRDSLLSVQMLVLIKEGNDYGIRIIQRSKNVAVAPERFQLVPSGGFEILNDSISGYSKYEIEDNYSAGCAIFREYLEEIFGIDEYEGKGIGSVNEALLKDDRIKEIESLLKEEKAEFRFLGSVIDLAGLRHELSFVLVIHDEEYHNNRFIGNEESKNRTFISNVTLTNFENRQDIWYNLHGPSAAMWKLFKESDLYCKLLNNKFEK